MEDLPATKLTYYDDMWKLLSAASFITHLKEEAREAVILDSTIFHPQGGGQPADHGVIANSEGDIKFIVDDVRLKNGVVFHYGSFNLLYEREVAFERGQQVHLSVDEKRRKLNARLHSAGHVMDACMRLVGLGHLEPAKGYHFPDGAFVEYKGTVTLNELQSKQKDLEKEANVMISNGGKVTASILPYKEALELCGGSLPDYIPKDSSPRIVQLGNNLGCPCGGTHVADMSEIGSMKISQIRMKKGIAKISYSIEL
ncbi:uncharacterized protein LOC18430278 isoform X2 [Amborella trichopoda]|nr:uncharacterized protein LOC18430278 isoform X2 [Amborella trichopoda]|eukprot:XP_011621909.1 uncharacterized protein LOC18430278 isoform X2 [Amborella trichopoda]